MDWIPPLATEFFGKPAWAWLLFLGLVLVLLVLDLGVLHRRARAVSVGHSLALSAFYIGIACAFGAWVWWGMGEHSGIDWFTGFFVEKTLALDNIFVINLIFGFFAIPAPLQHRVLFWGILGVIALRALMIGFGAALVSSFAWVLFLFGAFLVLTGVKMLVMGDKPADLASNPLLRFLRRRFRVTNTLHGEAFWVRLRDPATGRARLWLTPLFLALAMVEAADLIFAVDSVPAIFAITTDPYIVYTSNIFAILGLRALYFALAAMAHRFRYLKPALALVLVFIGGKIFWNQLVGKLDPTISLAVTLTLLIGGVALSLLRTRRDGNVGIPSETTKELSA
jgi:tellurite resistance protein TerC